jgi:hypothetical protein
MHDKIFALLMDELNIVEVNMEPTDLEELHTVLSGLRPIREESERSHSARHVTQDIFGISAMPTPPTRHL